MRRIFKGIVRQVCGSDKASEPGSRGIQQAQTMVCGDADTGNSIGRGSISANIGIDMYFLSSGVASQ